MLSDPDLKDLLNNNPIEGISKACDIIINMQDELSQDNDWNKAQYDILLEGAVFLEMALEANPLNIKIKFPKEAEKIPQNCSRLSRYIDDVSVAVKSKLRQQKIDSHKNKYKHFFKNTFAYEFSQSDLERIKNLLNETRKQIVNNKQLNDEHKQRLLARIEKLQSELNKRVSDLDGFWGLIGEAGIVLGKLGEDAKPIVDRVKEIAQIIWETQIRAEELPSNLTNPVMEHDKSDK